MAKSGSTFRLLASCSSSSNNDARNSSQRGVRLFSISVPISCRDALRVVPRADERLVEALAT